MKSVLRRALCSALASLLAASTASAATLFTTANGGSLVKVDTATRAISTIGNFGYSNVWTLEFNRSGNLYATVNWGAQLATVNRQTGAATVVGNLAQTIISLAVDGTNTLYGVGYNDGVLYRINPTTAALTAVGSSGVMYSMDSAVDPAGNIWTLDMGGRMYRLNKNTGAVVESIALPSGDVMSLSIDAANKAYVLPYSNPSTIYQIDLATKQVTNLGSISVSYPHGGAIEYDECDALRAELDALEANFVALQAQYTTLQATQTSTSAALTAAQTRVTQLEAQVAQLQTQNSTLATANASLTSDLAAANARIAGLETELSAAQVELTSTRATVTTLTEQLAQANATIASLTAERDQLAGQLADAQAQIVALTGANASLTNSLATANSRISALEGQVASLEAANSTLTSQLSAANARIGSLEAQVATLESQVASLNAANATLRGQLDAANATNASLQAENNTLTAALNSALASNSSLQAQLAAAQAEIARLNGVTTSVKASVDAIGTDLGTANGNPAFKVPGATVESQLGSLATAISQLNPGQKLALFKNLGGTKK